MDIGRLYTYRGQDNCARFGRHATNEPGLAQSAKVPEGQGEDTMRCSSAFAVVFAATLPFLSPAPADARNARSGGNAKPVYQAQVLRTSYGIPHIQAPDWGSLGYGYGYAFAQDNLCVLARDVLAATGTQSRYFGAATAASDLVYRMVNSGARVQAAWATLDADTQALLTGYADGYNRYLRDTGVGGLAADCRDQAWVRELSGEDVLMVLRKLLVRAGTGSFVLGLVGATPPAPVAAAAESTGPAARVAAAPDGDETQPVIDPAELPDFSVERFGSNAVALGSELTGGAGALLGNPHFPWVGIERFYAVHLTIPGRYDAMGASIYGFPLVNIGFNRHLAWSHTVSTARRFILRELTIVPSRPTTYVYDGRVVEMTPEPVSIEVRQPDGSLLTVNHTFWQTQFGPVVVPASVAPWTPVRAYALTDVNLENERAFRQYREMGTARDLEEFRGVLNRHAGLPWVNTIAADARGNAYYGDVGSMPHVTNAKLAACIKPGISAALAASRVYALDGSTSACDPGTDADSPIPGVFGASSMPSILRRDYAQNSNDSYWLANPAERLEGYSQIIGVDENRPQNFRTRLGITQIRDRQAGTDDGTGQRLRPAVAAGRAVRQPPLQRRDHARRRAAALRHAGHERDRGRLDHQRRGRLRRARWLGPPQPHGQRRDPRLDRAVASRERLADRRIGPARDRERAVRGAVRPGRPGQHAARPQRRQRRRRGARHGRARLHGALLRGRRHPARPSLGPGAVRRAQWRGDRDPRRVGCVGRLQRDQPGRAGAGRRLHADFRRLELHPGGDLLAARTGCARHRELLAVHRPREPALRRHDEAVLVLRLGDDAVRGGRHPSRPEPRGAAPQGHALKPRGRRTAVSTAVMSGPKGADWAGMRR